MNNNDKNDSKGEIIFHCIQENSKKKKKKKLSRCCTNNSAIMVGKCTEFFVLDRNENPEVQTYIYLNGNPGPIRLDPVLRFSPKTPS